MKHGYKYFRNADCEYFPCHKVADPSFFNCLFCFCPLYFLKDCGGNFTIKKGVKDCTNCSLPHEKGGYEHVLGRLKEYFKAERGKHSSQ